MVRRHNHDPFVVGNFGFPFWRDCGAALSERKRVVFSLNCVTFPVGNIPVCAMHAHVVCEWWNVVLICVDASLLPKHVCSALGKNVQIRQT